MSKIRMVGTLAGSSRTTANMCSVVESITMLISTCVGRGQGSARFLHPAPKLVEPEGSGRRYGKKMRACALKLFGPLVRETAERGY
jgi:hypothetical protein